MIAKCRVKNCLSKNITTKVCEDFEPLIYAICWQCGDRLKEIIGYELMSDFKFVIRLIENEVD